MKLHHIAWATNNIQETMQELQSLCAITDESQYVVDPNQNGAMLKTILVDGTRIEFVDGIIAKAHSYGGNNLYHLCFESDNYDNDIAKINQLGWIAVRGDREAILFGNRRVSFWKKPGYPMMEVLES